VTDSETQAPDGIFALVELRRSESEALVAAHKVLEAIETRARGLAYGYTVLAYGYPSTAKRIRAGAIAAERADVAQDAISSLLIALDVHADSKRARKALANL
jgi:hypothetical protein